MVSKYIDNKELKRVIEDGKLKPFRIRSVLKTQGILLTTTNAEQIAEQVYPILWGSSDIDIMSKSIDDGGNYIKSSVIEAEVKDTENIMDDFEDFFGNAYYGKSRYKLSGISRMDDNTLFVKLQYAVVRPGRNEFISTQYKNTDIIVTKISTNKALVDVRQASASEMKEINKFFDEAVKKDDSVSTRHISLQVLTNENKVAFFDEFVKRSFAGWRFSTVTKVALKKC